MSRWRCPPPPHLCASRLNDVHVFLRLLIIRIFSGLRGGPDRYSQKKGPRRTDYRVNLTGLPTGTSWQDIKRYEASHFAAV